MLANNKGFTQCCDGELFCLLILLKQKRRGKNFHASHINMLSERATSQSSSRNHWAGDASDGIRQSPLGERATEPTFGPSGTADRLN